MGKFNTAKTIKTTNKCGHVAYSMDDRSKLVTQVLTSFFNEAKFYGDNSEEMKATIERVVANDPEFIAKLAVYARREFNMRSVSHVLLAHLAYEPAGKPYTREAVKAACLRGDDTTELMACYLDMFGKPIPNALKKGINDVLTRFDEYTLAKYKGAGKAVKMRDLLRLCHPTPKDDTQSALWKKCLENTLEVPYTWETELSAKGNNAETWEALIDSGKVGYMALLRNLRNILKAEPSNIEKVYERIGNPEAVKRSRQLPFRFLSAYREVQNDASSRLFDALEDAVDASIENLPKILGRTVIAIDVSGSMERRISAKSSVTCKDIAFMLGMIANRICDDSVVYLFDSSIRKLSVSKRSGILYAVNSASCPGWATHMDLPFKKMIADNVQADRVIVLSDEQCNGYSGVVQRHADTYRRLTGNDIWVHAIDLQGYGTQQFHGAKTNIIAGWSEKVFNFINLAEQGESTLLETIKNYTY